MRVLLGLIAVLFIAVATNLVWLATSTVRIHNASQASIADVAYAACEVVHPIGTLNARASIFRFLDACGDDTLEILIGDRPFCRTYVEGELYHVDATIHGPDTVDCEHDDLLSSLFIVKAFW